MSSGLANLAKLSTGVVTKRLSSFDRTGGNKDSWPVGAGETVNLAEIKSPGCIKHLWMTTSAEDFNLRRLVLRMYWDGEETPSVLCPLGDFFGLGHAQPQYISSLPIQVAYLGMNCYFPMPYAAGAKITITNDSDQDSFIYFYIDYEEWSNPPADAGRFHAHWRRQLVLKKDAPLGPNRAGQIQRLNTDGRDNYVLLETEGRGHYVGCFLHIDTDEPGWWGEGDDMFFIDGEKWPPSLHGTGTEDYFCGAWNYNKLKETYNMPYFGYSFKGNSDYTGKHSQYRFHIEDPVRFERSLKFSIEHGHANDRQGDWNSTVYWYQIGRTKPLPEIGSFDERIPYAFGGLERSLGRARSELLK